MRAAAPAPPSVPAPRLRPHRQAVSPHPLPARALAALRTSATDPAVWVFPLLFVALLPLGGPQLLAGILALALAVAALQPRSTPRNWGRLIVAMLFLTFAVGLAADVVSSRHEPYSLPDEVIRTPPLPGPVSDIVEVDEAPRLINHDEIAGALERAYPPLLRDAGVGGTVVLEFVIGPDGTVTPRTVSVLESSNQAFSEAAIGVVRRMRFAPGMDDGEPVYVKVQLPVSFTTTD